MFAHWRCQAATCSMPMPRAPCTVPRTPLWQHIPCPRAISDMTGQVPAPQPLSTYGGFAPGHDDKRQRCATYVVIQLVPVPNPTPSSILSPFPSSKQRDTRCIKGLPAQSNQFAFSSVVNLNLYRENLIPIQSHNYSSKIVNISHFIEFSLQFHIHKQQVHFAQCISS